MCVSVCAANCVHYELEATSEHIFMAFGDSLHLSQWFFSSFFSTLKIFSLVVSSGTSLFTKKHGFCEQNVPFSAHFNLLAPFLSESLYLLQENFQIYSFKKANWGLEQGPSEEIRGAMPHKQCRLPPRKVFPREGGERGPFCSPFAFDLRFEYFALAPTLVWRTHKIFNMEYLRIEASLPIMVLMFDFFFWMLLFNFICYFIPDLAK